MEQHVTIIIAPDNGDGIPVEPELVRAAGINPGDTVAIRATKHGVVVHAVDPDQAWYWSDEFQAGEVEVEAELDAGYRQHALSGEELKAELGREAKPPSE